MAGRPGRSGGKPLPTNVKLLRGSEIRGPVRNEPKPRVRLPQCPKHLTDEARREWHRTGRLLEELGLMTAIDKAAFAAYCQAWARWVEAETSLQQYGTVIRSPANGLTISPYLRIADQALDQMKALLIEFGMTPSSRSRVEGLAVPKNDHADKAERFFGPAR